MIKNLTNILLAIHALELENFIDPMKKPYEKFIDVQLTNDNGETRTEQRLNKHYQYWKKSDQILLFWLISTLSQKVVGEVTRCKSALEAWTKLENLYSHRSMAKVLQLRQQLQSARKGSLSISDFILHIKTIGDALSAAGEDVPERDLLLSLLNRVGHEYDAIVVLVSSQQRTIDLEKTQFLFLMHEQRIEQLNSTSQISVPRAVAHFVATNVGDKKDQQEQ
ncbi:hypothetical protein ACOSQ4_006599 [Xanthoceras sorbifolium]